MAKISNVTARTFCAHINNSLVYSLITLCFHSSLLMGRSCLPSCVCVFFFPQRLPKSQPREALPIPLAGTVPVAVSAGTWWLARAISSATCPSGTHLPTARVDCRSAAHAAAAWGHLCPRVLSSIAKLTLSISSFYLMLKKVPTGRWLKCLRSNVWPPCHLWVSSCTEGITLRP